MVGEFAGRGSIAPVTLPFTAVFPAFLECFFARSLSRVQFTDADIAEFIALCEADGVKLTADDARPIAARLVLLYRHLARPTPSELAAGLAKRRREGTVEGDPPSPAAPAADLL